MLDVVVLVGQLEVAAVDGYQAQARVEGLRMAGRLSHGQAAALHELSQRGCTNAAAQAADGGLGHSRRLGCTGSPSQALGHGGENLLVGGFRVQAQRHAVVGAGNGRKAPQSLGVAAVGIQNGMHHLGGYHARQQAGAQVVGQSGARSQCSLGSCHCTLRRCGGVIVREIALSEQYWVRPQPDASGGGVEVVD